MVLTARRYGFPDLVRIPMKCAPGAGLFLVLSTLLLGLAPTLKVMLTAKFIDTAVEIAAGNEPIERIYTAILGIVLLIAYLWLSNALSKFAVNRMELALQRTLRTAVTDKRARLQYVHVENTDTWDLIQRVSGSPEQKFTQAFNNLLGILTLVLQVGGVGALLMAQVWWAALVIMAFSIPLFYLAVQGGKATYQASREVSKHGRRYGYLSELLTGREAAEERALFGYGDFLNDMAHEVYEEARKVELKTRLKWYLRMKSGSLVTALISILIVFVLLPPVLQGALSVGMFISLINAAFSLVQTMSWQLTSRVDRLAQDHEYLKDLTQFSHLEEEQGAELPPTPQVPSFESLEFRNVRFKYPGTDNLVLKDVSFRIEAGKHYAFVGVNGAGKTTITKIICGLYDQYEGEILLNGRNIREYSHADLKSIVNMVYQDFARYYITLRDNIALGSVNRMPNIDWALEKVGLAEAAAKLPQGLDTPLGKIKEGGQDLSGGEWQRVALARALVNPAPLIMLDEPTAALDPISESWLYQEFGDLSSGKTTIFISHRLGSTKLADHIFVLSDGRIVEQGNHAELMQHRGIYAEMFDSQRSWYQ